MFSSNTGATIKDCTPYVHGDDMKVFDTLGSWILDTKSGFVFGCLLLLGLLAVGGYHWLTKAETVTLSAREFICVSSEPHGLGTRCITYSRSH